MCVWVGGWVGVGVGAFFAHSHLDSLLNLVVAEKGKRKKGNTFGKCSLSETVNAKSKVDQLSQLRNPLNVYVLYGGESETFAGMVAMNTIGWCLSGS